MCLECCYNYTNNSVIALFDSFVERSCGFARIIKKIWLRNEVVLSVDEYFCHHVPFD